MKRFFLYFALIICGISFAKAQTINTESFNAAPTMPAGWTVDLSLGTNGSSLFVPVTSGSYPTCTPRTAPGMVEFNNYDASSSGEIQTLITPAISFANRNSVPAQLTLWFYRDADVGASGTLSNLQVYVNTTNSLTGATLLPLSATTITSISPVMTQAPIVTTAGWYQYTYDIPTTFNGTTNYFLFKGYGDWYNNIFMDDISWPTWTPMSYSSSTIDQPVTYAARPGQAAPIERIKVTTVGSVNPMSVTSLGFSLPAGTAAGDIASVKVVYTGTSAAYSATAPTFGTAATSPSFAVTGNQALAAGDNYFWLVYNLSPAAVANDPIDATCTSLMVGGIERMAAATNPTGQRTIKNAMAGVVTVGPTGTYTSLSTACGDYSWIGSSAPVTFSITGNLTETLQATLAPPDLGAANALVIKPAVGVTPTITTTHGGQDLYIVGMTNLTIDGSNTVNGKTRDLTFINTGTSTVSHGIYVENSSVTGFTLKNVKIQNNAVAYGIVMLYLNNSTVDNCEVYKAASAITVQGACANMTITNNVFGSTDPLLAFSATPVLMHAVALPNEITNLNFSNNIVQGLASAAASTVNRGAIFLNVVNSTINGNVFRNLKTTGTSASIYGAQLQALNAAAPFQNLNSVFSNNVITDLSSTSQTIGLALLNSEGMMFYHNVFDIIPTSGGTLTVGALFQASGTIKFRNNIVENKTLGTGSNYVMYCSGTAVTISEIDNNIYNLAAAGTSSFGVYNGTVQASINDWRTALSSGKDGLSFAKVPYFTSDYHITGVNVGDKDFIAPLIPAVIKDIDNETRVAEANYVGIDQALATISYTQNLSASDYVCKTSGRTYTVAAQIGSFADGIARTGVSPITYTWKKNAVAVPFTSYYVINGNQLTIQNADSTVIGGYTATANFGLSALNTTICNFDVDYPITIAQQPVQTGACWGGAPTVTLSVVPTGKYVGFQWQKLSGSTWNNVTGATSKDFIMPLTGNSDDVKGTYRVIVYSPGNTIGGYTCGPSQLISNSADVLITIPLSVPAIASSAPSNTVCEGTNVTLTATAQGTITGYKWQRLKNGNWYDIALTENNTANSKDLVLIGVKPDESATFRTIILGSSQCSPNQIPTPSYVLTIMPKFYIKTQPKTVTVCEGDFVKLSIIGSSAIDAYQWYVDGQKIEATTNSTAKESYFFIEKSLYNQSGAYTCELTVTDCQGTKQVMSDVAEVYILKPTEITKDPVAQNMVALGGKVTFVVEAHNKGKIPPFYKDKYQWFRYHNDTKKVDSLLNNDRMGGTNSSIFTIVKITDKDYTATGDYYFATVEGMCGSDTSAKVYVVAPPSVTIGSNPLPVATCEGLDIDFTVDAASSDATLTLNYQWYKDGTALVNSARIIGADKNQLTIKSAIPTDKGNYYAIATINGMTYSATSDQASADITAEAKITAQPAKNLDIQTGKDGEITVTATGDNVTYQWVKDNTDLTGETNATLKITAAQATNAGAYWVKVSNVCKDVVSDSCVVTVTKESVSDVKDAPGITFSVAPNPMNESAELTFASEQGDDVRISINDITGKEIAVLFEGATSKGLNKLDVNANKYNLTSGVYIVKLVRNSNVYTTKFMVNR